MSESAPSRRFLEPEWRERVESTNSTLLSRLEAGEEMPSGFVLAAREQTEGRGRYDRRWVSRPGRDLTFSFLWSTAANPQNLPSLTMAVALGVSDTLSGFGVKTQVKWPNDVLVDGCKICGLLAEAGKKSKPNVHRLVIGVGVNVNMAAHEVVAIDRPATSILIETGRTHAVGSVLEGILEALPAWLSRWHADGFDGIRDDWCSRHCALGNRIAVGEGDQRREGALYGFGGEGQLLLSGEDGRVVEVWAGDVGLLQETQ